MRLYFAKRGVTRRTVTADRAELLKALDHVEARARATYLWQLTAPTDGGPSTLDGHIEERVQGNRQLHGELQKHQAAAAALGAFRPPL